MKDVNKILLIGRLGTDPVQRETKNGMAVVHFPVATSRKVIEQEEGAEAKEKEETQWHKIVVWGKQAEACKQYLGKGVPVYIEGSVRTRKYKTKQGEPRFSFEVHAENVCFLGRKRVQEASPEGVTEASVPVEAEAAISA